MTTEDRSVFIDTNILVYANVAETPMHSLALKALIKLRSAYNKLWISRQILREYISSVTKDDPLIQRVPSSLIIEQIHFFENNFLVAEESAVVTHNLLSIIERYPTKGRKIHDANIVATMMAYNIPVLLTQNKKDFERFSAYIQLLTIDDILK